MESLEEGPSTFLSRSWGPRARPDLPLELVIAQRSPGAESGLGAGCAGKGGGCGLRLITTPAPALPHRTAAVPRTEPPPHTPAMVSEPGTLGWGGRGGSVRAGG